jgi:alpha-amylase/alpha-mannosidase (GH57 family)
MRYICIHAHFYQPPRENPWLETIESQPSAYPYHDWNERITAECYAPNSASRIVDERGRITQIVNNYSRISFNFGPTLLSWLEDNAADTYANILEADKLSRERFSGHGSAIAQAYNHMILPLATRQDKETQIVWGIRDFERRFGRLPEGMWLPETAVDLETLEILAANGITFTILAPSQAAKARAIKHGARWKDVTGARIDPTRAYLARLRHGSQISLFFYDGPIARAVAFEKLLNSGEQFAQRLMSGFSEHREWAQLVHIATDGESYGHHHPHGDMALAYALKQIEDQRLAALTNYGEYLEKHPPGAEVQIIEQTAWSCSHGVQRWYADCGCNSGAPLRQTWRGPLRSALDWLRDAVLAIAWPRLQELFKEPQAARNAYIDVVLDRSPESIEKFLYEHAKRWFTDEERVEAISLMEMQRHTMLMFTSCGWFFDEVSGIETVKVLQYAGRVIQLATQLFPEGDIESAFLERLTPATSNFAEHKNAAEIYRKSVRPAFTTLEDVAAHYAIASLFQPQGDIPLYAYFIDSQDFSLEEFDRARLAIGRAQITSTITTESKLISFASVYLGDHDVNAGVRSFEDGERYQKLQQELSRAFRRGEWDVVAAALRRQFGEPAYGLASLFADERNRILSRLIESTLRDAEASYRKIYEEHSSLLRFLGSYGVKTPPILRVTSEFALNAALEHELSRSDFDQQRIEELLQQAREEQIALDRPGLGYRLAGTVTRIVEDLRNHPGDHALMMQASRAVQLARSLDLPVNLWRAQNVFYEMARRFLHQHSGSPQWLVSFLTLGEKLGIDTRQFDVRTAMPVPA